MMYAVPIAELFTVTVATVIALGVLLAAAARFTSLRPVKWILDRLVVGPAGEVLDRRVDGAVNEAMRPLDSLVRDIHYEMHPNSGKSMRDVLERVEGSTIYISGEVERLKEHQDEHGERLSRVEGALSVIVHGSPLASAPPSPPLFEFEG